MAPLPVPPLVISPDEIYTWSDSQIEGEIATTLPEGVELVCSWKDGLWSVRGELVEGGEVSVLWAHEHLDRRMALLNTYAALWLKDKPPVPEDSPWSTERPRPTRQSVAQYVRRRQVSDPEDLDPSEVASVYGVSSPEDGD